jgi:hypothetical protein
MNRMRILREYERDGVRVVAREHVAASYERAYTVEASVANEIDARVRATSAEDAGWKAERLFDAIYIREYGEAPRAPRHPDSQGPAAIAGAERG